MKKQLGFINIPSWVFLMSFVGIILVLVELVRLGVWVWNHIEVVIK